MASTRPTITLITTLALALVGCGDDGRERPSTGASSPGAQTPTVQAAHRPTAPHGGALVALGDRAAYAEIKLDDATGKLTVWLLNDNAAQPIRSPQVAVDMTITPLDAKGNPGLGSLSVSLPPVGDPQTGETVGDTSRFEAEAKLLTDTPRFTGTIKLLMIGKDRFEDVAFRYPEGGE
ncbi:MAG: hypothetical protein GC159_14145 [Phycisphaera sp.]|nr:hypothetical protein [Phycisphaera sp.]